MSLEQVSSNKSFNGTLTKYKLKSESLGGTETSINLFLPADADKGTKVPVLYYLAGLTCNEDTGAQKGGFLRDAAEHGIALVFPDTSPRGAGIEGEDDDWDFGTGAGFYLNATSAKYSKHYNVYKYLTSELPSILSSSSLPLDLSRSSIFGHSMGGHGALTLFLLNPTLYRSASAFAPIAHPTKAPWGEKAFSGYLKGGLEEGKQWDTVELIKAGKGKEDGGKVLVDVGLGDNFYKQKQLLPEDLEEAVKGKGWNGWDIRKREGYDHSYYFISTFGPEHIAFHAQALKA